MRPSTQMAYRRHAHVFTHTLTHQKLQRLCSSSASPPVFCDFFRFSSLPCPHLLWSKISGRYQRSWNQSLSLLIVGTLIHYISTKVLSFPLYSITSHLLFPSHSTLLLLSQNHSQFSLALSWSRFRNAESDLIKSLAGFDTLKARK